MNATRAVRDAERRAGEALRTMTDDEGLSVREAADWCGSGVTVREVTRLRRLAGQTRPGGTAVSARASVQQVWPPSIR